MDRCPNQHPSVDPGPRRVAFIGEAPGATELSYRVPFCGASGSLLNRLLAAVGLPRNTVFVGNVSQHQPATNDFNRFAWDGPEIQDGIARLLADLHAFRPNLVVTLGNVPLHLFRHGNVAPARRKKGTGYEHVWPSSVTRWRGSLFHANPALAEGAPPWKCLASIHPAFVVRSWGEGFNLRQDLRRAAAECASPALTLPALDFAYGPSDALTATEIVARLAAIREARAPVGYDLEGNTIVGCQAFATSPTSAFTIVTDALGADAPAVWHAVVAVLEDPLVPKWTWNAHHELAVLRLAHGITLRNWEDGMALWFERWPELPKGLKYAASILTRQPYWAEGIEFSEDDSGAASPATRGVDFWRYNAIDAATTLELALHPQLQPTGETARARYAMRRRLVEALTWASLHGIPYDAHLAARLADELRPRLWAAQARVNELAGVVVPLDDALLPAAAKAWCHAVKLRKFAGYAKTQPDSVTAESQLVGTASCVNQNGETPLESGSPPVGNGETPSKTCDSVDAAVTERLKDLAALTAVTMGSATLEGFAKPSNTLGSNPLGEPAGAGPSSAFSTATAPIPGSIPGSLAISGRAEQAGNSGPCYRDTADGLLVEGPVNGATPSVGLAGGNPAATATSKRKRAAKPVAPPPTLTWDAAISIAKQGGADALAAIRDLAASPATLDAAAHGRLADLLHLSVNVKSTKQVVALLDRCKLPKVYRTRDGGDAEAPTRSKDAEVLLSLYLKTGHPVTTALLAAINLRTQLEESAQTASADGRIRASFLSCGTTTDRTTCKKWLDGTGGGLHQVPSAPVNFRRCYVAPPGHDWWKLDLTGADAWTVAARCATLGDDTMLADLRAGLRIPTLLGLALEGVAINRLTRDELAPLCRSFTRDWRDLAFKRCVYGSAYGMSPRGIRRVVVEDSYNELGEPRDPGLEFCARLQSIFLGRYWGIELWHRDIERQLKQTGAVACASGLTREFFGRRQGLDGRIDESTLREAYALEPQSVTTFVINRALDYLWTAGDNRDAAAEPVLKPLLTVHDEVDAVGPVERRDWCRELLGRALAAPVTIGKVTLTIPYVAKWGTSWGEAVNK